MNELHCCYSVHMNDDDMRSATKQPASASNDYKALICIFILQKHVLGYIISVKKANFATDS